MWYYVEHPNWTRPFNMQLPLWFLLFFFFFFFFFFHERLRFFSVCSCSSGVIVCLDMPTFECKWYRCNYTTRSGNAMREHIRSNHIENYSSRHCHCLWKKCPRYDYEYLTYDGFANHIESEHVHMFPRTTEASKRPRSECHCDKKKSSQSKSKPAAKKRKVAVPKKTVTTTIVTTTTTTVTRR